MRGTAHLIPADDHGWLVPLFAERIARWSRGRLDKLGVSDAAQGRALAAVGKALDAGPLTRTEALAEAARVGFEANVQTRTHLAILLVVEGIACIGPDAGRESVLVAAHDWLGPQKRRGREESLAELARRYVVAFAPVTERDFALWSGLPLRDCRAGLAAISGDLDRREIAGETLIVPRGWRARPGRTQVVRLLPAYDTYLMGYASRDHAVDPDGERRVLPGGGVLRPTICVDGLLVGLWTSSRSGRRLTITLEPFAPLGDDVLDALGAEAADVGRFEAAEGTLA